MTFGDGVIMTGPFWTSGMAARIGPVTEAFNRTMLPLPMRSRAQVTDLSGMPSSLQWTTCTERPLMPPLELTSCSHHCAAKSWRVPTVASGPVVGAIMPITNASAACAPLAQTAASKASAKRFMIFLPLGHNGRLRIVEGGLLLNVRRAVRGHRECLLLPLH